MSERPPCRGEVWTVSPGLDEAGLPMAGRPALVFSVDKFNSGAANLVVILPMTTLQHDLPIHIRVEPPEGGVNEPHFVMCEMIRAIPSRHFLQCQGTLRGDTLALVEESVRILLGL